MKSPVILQAIVTRFISPTNFRGSRVKATAAAGNLTIEWDCALGMEENHVRAAQELAVKFDWIGLWYGGGMPGGNGYVFVCSPAAHADAPAFVTKRE